MSVINTNITSMIGQSNLNKSQNALQTSMERLSSGLRINSAKDDAAGQAIANRFSSQITGLGQAQRNANDGISIAQTAEGALNQVNDNLQRVRELTVQAANGTNSESDLGSIQDEINQRLAEIDRISEETDFNGTRVLADNNALQIQVGANDGQTISVGLQQINAQTLGLDGFNVDGSGVTQNRGATVTDVLAQDGVDAGFGGANDYQVTTTFEAAELSDIVSTLNNGDTVEVTGGATYTYDADADNFTFTREVDGSGTGITDLAASISPNTGSISGSFENGAGNIANFDVDSTGNITIGGEQAFLTTTGELTTNNAGTAVTANLETLLSNEDGIVSIGGTDYTLGDDGTDPTVSFTDTASASDVLAASAGNATEVTLNAGLAQGTVNFDAAGVTTDAYVDFEGELTTIDSFTTDFTVNPETGEVSVTGNSANAGDYALEVGATVNVAQDGRLTTDETSPGDRTENPLSALDAALSQVDSLRSDLGAIQNRFESAIDNLNTNETNLSAARSRIEDADYAMEVANMTRAQILQQAGTSVLAQANQLPQNVLSLLG